MLRPAVRHFALSALLSPLGLGCATLNYEAAHKPAEAGSMSAPRDGQVTGDIPFDDERIQAIQVFDRLDVHGFVYDKDTSRLDSPPGSAHTVIGHVRVHFPLMENMALLFWFTDYRPEQSWRAGLCYWQVPLVWITLGIWGILPLHYPCNPGFWHTGAMREVAGEETREEILFDALRAEAVRKGGNAVVGAQVNDRNANGWIVRLIKK